MAEIDAMLEHKNKMKSLACQLGSVQGRIQTTATTTGTVVKFSDPGLYEEEEVANR